MDGIVRIFENNIANRNESQQVSMYLFKDIDFEFFNGCVSYNINVDGDLFFNI